MPKVPEGFVPLNCIMRKELRDEQVLKRSMLNPEPKSAMPKMSEAEVKAMSIRLYRPQKRGKSTESFSELVPQRSKSAMKYRNKIFDRALREHTSPSGEISLDDVRRTLQKDGYLHHLPEIGSVVEKDGSESERAARLLNTLSVYLMKPVRTLRESNARGTMVDVRQFDHIIGTLRNGISDRKDEDAIALNLAEVMVKDKLKRGITFDELGFEEKLFNEDGSLDEPAVDELFFVMEEEMPGQLVNAINEFMCNG